MNKSILLGLFATAFLASSSTTLAGTWVPLNMNVVYAALAYDSAVPGAVPVIQKFFDKHIPIIPLPADVINDRYDPVLDVIYWNPTAALQTATDSGAGTGKYISPALLLLDAINHAVAHSISASGFANLSASPTPLFDTLEQQRIISGLDSARANPNLHNQTPSSVSDADEIVDFSAGNGLENAVAAKLGEPVRTNNIMVLKDTKIVEGVTYMTAADPTWHRN